MSRDMMGAFELYQPDTVEGAVELLERGFRHLVEARQGASDELGSLAPAPLERALEISLAGRDLLGLGGAQDVERERHRRGGPARLHGGD